MRRGSDLIIEKALQPNLFVHVLSADPPLGAHARRYDRKTRRVKVWFLVSEEERWVEYAECLPQDADKWEALTSTHEDCLSLQDEFGEEFLRRAPPVDGKAPSFRCTACHAEPIPLGKVIVSEMTPKCPHCRAVGWNTVTPTWTS